MWVGDPYKQHNYTAGCGSDVGRGPIQTAYLHGWVWVGDPYKQHIYTAGCGLDVDMGETIILTIDLFVSSIDV